MISRFFFLFFFFPAIASAQGIAFEHITWVEALEKAQKTKKMIFLDAFTTWCGPCKMLNAQTFPDSAVGAFFNKHFINLKIDMEKGEGIQLARQYGVDVYPTLLFFQPDGIVAHRSAGFQNVAGILNLGAIAVNPDRNLRGLETRYSNGDQSRELILQLIAARSAAYDPRTGALVETYLKQESDLNTPENKQMILQNSSDPFSLAFTFLVNNKTAFLPDVTEDQIATYIDQIFENYLQARPVVELDEVKRLYTACYPDHEPLLASSFPMIHYLERGDYVRYVQAALDHYTRFPSTDTDELNESAALFAENATDQAALKQALSWAQQSVQFKETSHNQYTLALLLSKTGKKNEAKTAAKRSIELAKAAGLAYKQQQALLSELERKP